LRLLCFDIAVELEELREQWKDESKGYLRIVSLPEISHECHFC
jgi:hypothetical protein